MIYDDLVFHNVAELRPVAGSSGLRLQRVPESIRDQLDDGTAGVMLSPAGSEIRFRIAEGQESAIIRLSAEEPTTAYVYHGPFQGRVIHLDREPTEVTIKPHRRMAQLKHANCRVGSPYDPALVRICFAGDYPEPVYYHGHGDGVCLPRSSDVPRKTWLAYGSSITHGTSHAGACISYPAHAAWILGYDLRNLGASGCCLCERAIADYIAMQPCDLVTLELSVNMLGSGYTVGEFLERAGYLIERVADADPDRQVVCITIFPHFRDIHKSIFAPVVESTPEEYRQALRDLVDGLNRPNLARVEGPDLLPDISMLSADLIHPGVRGMVQIGEALALEIEQLEMAPRVRTPIAL